jgi:hydroxyacylglutathione hydrolase
MHIVTFPVAGLGFKNQCYLIYKQNTGILIDPAWDFTLIDNFIESNKISITGILLTHSHFDHTNLAERFGIKYNVPVFMSAEEIAYYGFSSTNLVAVNHLRRVEIEAFDVIPLLTPGHTAGSLCYLIGNHLFSGDTVFIEGVGICIGKGSDVNKMYDSVQFIKNNISGNTFIWPGHSFGQAPGKDLNYLLESNIYFKLDVRKYFIEFRMRGNQASWLNFY